MKSKNGLSLLAATETGDALVPAALQVVHDKAVELSLSPDQEQQLVQVVTKAVDKGIEWALNYCAEQGWFAALTADEIAQIEVAANAVIALLADLFL